MVAGAIVESPHMSLIYVWATVYFLFVVIPPLQSRYLTKTALFSLGSVFPIAESKSSCVIVTSIYVQLQLGVGVRVGVFVIVMVGVGLGVGVDVGTI